MNRAMIQIAVIVKFIVEEILMTHQSILMLEELTKHEIIFIDYKNGSYNIYFVNFYFVK